MNFGYFAYSVRVSVFLSVRQTLCHLCILRFQSIQMGVSGDSPSFRTYKRKQTHALLRRANVERVCANVERVCANVERVCANVERVCANVERVCANVERVCANVERVCANVERVCANVERVCANVASPFYSTRGIIQKIC